MKQITMDWETYKKEIGDINDKYDKGFEDGVNQCQERLDPILNIINQYLNDKLVVDLKPQLLLLMKEACEFEKLCEKKDGK